MTENMSRFSLRYHPQPKVKGGFYLASLADIGVGPSRHGIYPMVQMIFRTEGSRAFTYLWRIPLTEEDIHKLTQVHKAIGLPTPSLPRLKSGEDVMDKIHYEDSGVVLIHLVPEIYQGKWRSTISEIRPFTQAKIIMALTGDEEPSL